MMYAPFLGGRHRGIDLTHDRMDHSWGVKLVRKENHNINKWRDYVEDKMMVAQSAKAKATQGQYTAPQLEYEEAATYINKEVFNP